MATMKTLCICDAIVRVVAADGNKLAGLKFKAESGIALTMGSDGTIQFVTATGRD